jgi:hypothetical protein
MTQAGAITVPDRALQAFAANHRINQTRQEELWPSLRAM